MKVGVKNEIERVQFCEGKIHQYFLRGVITALYDKSIKLSTLILNIMENVLKIGGNRDMLCVSQKRVVKVVGVIIQNGRLQRFFFGVETYSIIV